MPLAIESKSGLNATKTNMKSIISLRFFLLFAIVILIFSGVVRLFTPPNQVPIGNFIDSGNPFTNTKTTFKNTTFTTSSIATPPEKFEIYTAQVANYYETYFRSLTQNLALKQSPNAETLFIGPEYVFSYNISDNSALISKKDIPTDYTPQIVDEAKMLDTATSRVQALFESMTLKPDISAISYYEYSYELLPSVNKSSAQVMIIPYSYAFTTYPVFFDKNTTPPIVVTITTDFIQKIDVQFVGVTIASTTQISSISLETAQNNIKNNNGTLIAAGSESVVELALDQISNATLSFSQFEYRFIPETSTFVPFYAFVGSGQDQNGEQISIKVITPAVPTN